MIARCALARHYALATIIGVVIAGPACSDTPVGPSPETAGPNGGESGLVPLNDQPWTGLTTMGWGYQQRTSAKRADIVMDATAPSSPPHVLRMIFTPTMSRDTEPGVHWIQLPTPREIQASWSVKLSANWTPSPAGAAKMTFLHVWPNGLGQVYSALGESSSPHSMVVNTEWAPYGQKFWVPNVATTHIVYNRWYRIDWYLKWESMSGAGDGVLRWWVNGELNGNHGDVRCPVRGTGFEQCEFAPTVQRPPSAEQYMYVDHTTISTAVKRAR